MEAWIMALAAVAAVPMGQTAAAQEVPAAIFTDPARDAAHPARMEVLHIPSGGGAINGLTYVAAGVAARAFAYLRIIRRDIIPNRNAGGRGGILNSNL